MVYCLYIAYRIHPDYYHVCFNNDTEKWSEIWKSDNIYSVIGDFYLRNKCYFNNLNIDPNIDNLTLQEIGILLIKDYNVTYNFLNETR